MNWSVVSLLSPDGETTLFNDSVSQSATFQLKLTCQKWQIIHFGWNHWTHKKRMKWEADDAPYGALCSPSRRWLLHSNNRRSESQLKFPSILFFILTNLFQISWIKIFRFCRICSLRVNQLIPHSNEKRGRWRP